MENSDICKEERLSDRKEPYRLRMAREMPEEREARLLSWCDHICSAIGFL